MSHPASDQSSVLQQLLRVIRERRDHPPARSYTTALLAGGVPKIGGKIEEEAAELVEAAAETGPDARAHMIHEAADLLYHVFVLLRHRDIEWEEIESELGRRFGICGLDEKESRSQ